MCLHNNESLSWRLYLCPEVTEQDHQDKDPGPDVVSVHAAEERPGRPGRAQDSCSGLETCFAGPDVPDNAQAEVWAGEAEVPDQAEVFNPDPHNMKDHTRR